MYTDTAQSSDIVILTSFGPFLDVVDNPSSRVASEVMKELQRAMSVNSTVNYAFQIRHDESLEVSAKGVVRYFTSINSEIDEYYRNNSLEHGSQNEGHQRHWLIHFGLHGKATSINIELTGHNCATFEKGDVTGYKCVNKPILCYENAPPSDDDHDVFIDQEGVKNKWKVVLPKSYLLDRPTTEITLSSQLSEAWATNQCNDLNNNSNTYWVNEGNTNVNNDNTVKLCVSHDPGRYVCNFTLFLSLLVSHSANLNIYSNLRESKKRNPFVISLFIHVVKEDCMTAKEQASLIFQFLLRAFEDNDAVMSLSHVTN